LHAAREIGKLVVWNFVDNIYFPGNVEEISARHPEEDHAPEIGGWKI
jgi:hypothetical protein